MPEIWRANLMEHMTPWSVQWLCLLPELWGQIFQFMADPTHLDYPRYTGVWKKSYFEYSLQYFLPTYWYSLRWGAVASGKLDGSRLQVDWVLNIENMEYFNILYWCFVMSVPNILSFAILNILNVFNIFHEIAKDLKYVGYFYCCGYSAMWRLQVKFPMVNLGPRDKWDIKGKVKKRKIN